MNRKWKTPSLPPSRPLALMRGGDGRGEMTSGRKSSKFRQIRKRYSGEFKIDSGEFLLERDKPLRMTKDGAPSENPGPVAARPSHGARRPTPSADTADVASAEEFRTGSFLPRPFLDPLS